MLPGKINAMETVLIVTEGIPHCRVRSTRDSSCSLVSLNTHRALFVVEKRVDSPKISPRFGGVGASRQHNRKEKLCSLSLGLTTLSGEVNARFIMLLSLIDLTQGLVRGGKAGRQS